MDIQSPNEAKQPTRDTFGRSEFSKVTHRWSQPFCQERGGRCVEYGWPCRSCFRWRFSSPVPTPELTPFVMVVPRGYVSPVWIVLDPEGRMFRCSSAGTVPITTRPGVPPSVRYVGAWLGCGVVRSRPAIVTPARPEGLWW